MPRAILVLVLVLAACKSDEARVQPQTKTPPAPRAPVVTDRQEYVMHEGETTIVATYTAPADHDVYLVHCNGQFAVGLQRPVGDKWEHVWAPAMNACFSASIVIRAGTSYQSTIIVAPQRMDAKIDTGQYRVIWHGLLGAYDPKASPPGVDLPVEQRVSAPIRIVASVAAQ